MASSIFKEAISDARNRRMEKLIDTCEMGTVIDIRDRLPTRNSLPRVISTVGRRAVVAACFAMLVCGTLVASTVGLFFFKTEPLNQQEVVIKLKGDSLRSAPAGKEFPYPVLAEGREVRSFPAEEGFYYEETIVQGDSDEGERIFVRKSCASKKSVLVVCHLPTGRRDEVPVSQGR